VRGGIREGEDVDYILHTFAILDYPPHFVPDSLRVKCELRDVMHTFAAIEESLDFSSLYVIDLAPIRCP